MAPNSLLQAVPGLEYSKSDSNQGSHRNQSGSISSLFSTLIPTLALGLVLLSVFLALRRSQQRLYAPRTYIETLRQNEKTPKAQPTLFGWIRDFRSLPDTYVLNHHSLDGYLFIRFFRLIVIICFVGCCVTWPILLPVNATGGNGQQGLDRFTFGNVQHTGRYYVHALIACIFLGFVMFVINRESTYLINLRQAYLLSPWNASRISSRTVLFTSVPKEYLNESTLRDIFPSVRQIWYATDCKKLTEMIQKRDDTALRLEAAEIELLKKVNARRMKAEKSRKSNHVGTDENRLRWLNVVKRPSHRVTPLVGEKVDTIEHDRRWLSELIPEIKKIQVVQEDKREAFVGAVFMEFDSQTAAHDAFSMPIYNQPDSMVARQVGVMPDEIVWDNVGLNSLENNTVGVATTAFICAMIIFWGIPVSFVGILSNIKYLADHVRFLAWLNDLPKPMLGLLTGLLPSVLLSALMSVVPILCRWLAQKSGAVTLSQVELQIQEWYFAFLVIQVFLITTFSSGATTVAYQIINEPRSAVDLLAKNLPKASNFYVSYFVLYGVAMSAVYLVNFAELFNLYILGRFTGTTPRKIFDLHVSLPAPSWGSEYPKWANLAIIAITYSCIAPLVLGFATIGLGLLYLAYRYNFLYVYGSVVDTKGLAYAKALQQLSVGVYLSELCLIGLFSLRLDDNKMSGGPVLIMTLFLIFTILYHISTKRSIEPLTRVLPRNLLVESEEPYRDETDAAENGSGHVPDRINNIQALHNGSSAPPLWRRLIFPQSQSPASLAASLHPSFQNPLPPYPEAVAKRAYYNPAITSEPPKLWIVHDELGISKREVEQTEKIIPITDQGAGLDEKNSVVLEVESLRQAPIWKERVVY